MSTGRFLCRWKVYNQPRRATVIATDAEKDTGIPMRKKIQGFGRRR
jgi:hypothetical protein